MFNMLQDESFSRINTLAVSSANLKSATDIAAAAEAAARIAAGTAAGTLARPKSHALFVADGVPDFQITDELERNGFSITQISTRANLDRVRQAQADAIILDSDNSFDAGQWCRMLRGHQIMTPLNVMLKSITAFDEALLLELGADSVVDNATEPRVIASRLRALIRRASGNATPGADGTLQFGRLIINQPARRVVLADKTIEVSSSEFDLLWLLASHAGEVMKRDQVQMELRGFTSDDSHRFIDARLYRLRQRFGNTAEVISRIRTVRPYGYLFAKIDW